VLNPQTQPIGLGEALRLAGVRNPEIQIAQNRITQEMALRQLAAAQFLPNLNTGTNFNHHLGKLQQANGNIIDVNRDALYLGLGAGAVGGGTVTVPGIAWTGNTSEVIFQNLVRRQNVARAQSESVAVQNNVLLRAASAYLDLLRAASRHAIAIQIREDAREVARVTASFAKTGIGRQADAHRAATEYELRNTEVVLAETEMNLSSARLAELLGLDAALRLVPAEECALPHALVPEPVPLPELLAMALVQRPELQARQAAVRAALLELRSAKVLPFSPNLLLGFSAGSFGGGSVLPNTPRFGNFGDRTDFDAILFWSLRNLGVGNLAQIRFNSSLLRQNELRELETLNRIGAEVAAAYARSQARLAQIDIAHRSIQASREAYKEDLLRTRNRDGLPIEVLDSLRLLGRSRYAYLDAIIDYNRAQFELYVAIGQPPADFLARPVPRDLIPSQIGKE
jgi:outer membrane protein TolC